MRKMWLCFSHLPERSEPKANFEAGKRYGSDDVHAGAKLWSGGNCIEQSWNGDWKNECVSSRTGNRQASARMSSEKLLSGYRTKAEQLH